MQIPHTHTHTKDLSIVTHTVCYRGHPRFYCCARKYNCDAPMLIREHSIIIQEKDQDQKIKEKEKQRNKVLILFY